MKRGILLATLMVTAAGVASANLLTDESRTAPAPAGLVKPRAMEPATPVSLAPAAQIEPAALETAPAPVTQKQPKAAQKLSVEARQAPVPLQVKPRATAKLPTIESLIATKSADAKSADAKPGDEAAGDTPAAASDGFNEAKAKAAIEADGYKGVAVLRKGANGVWHATALRGKTEVKLTVDASGSVSAD